MTFSADLFNSIGVVGLAVAFCVLLVVALTQGWLVLGRTYTAVLTRADTDAATIATLTKALAEKNAADEMSTALLTTIRREIDAAKAGGET